MRLGRLHLFVAFAFTVMADPVSSVAYAIEAALRALDGEPESLVATMALVVATIAVISGTYSADRPLPARGRRAARSRRRSARAGRSVPLGALLVDFTLTVAISCSAGAAALIAYEPDVAALRLPLALGLAAAVALGVLFGHRGRIGFAIATQGFRFWPSS